MIAAAAVLAGIAALLHAYIFVLESVVFRSRGRTVFGVRDDAEAKVVERWAFNQGFYNLFLAVGAAVGALVLVTGDRHVGAALIFLAAGSMVGAGSVLLATDRRLLRGALVQIVPGALAVVATALSL
ncbi:DUF1304 domain-containing protein [Rhodococcus sp. MEB064]|uniref:DUF1304 domain-containing protein n=1 Tax=Rhodococcus sp. MEB064 TaxID=1587522 RepID=UPI0005AC6FC2|nr:DUF1304 domain-containing protein [Rhodococcus sp. MEB064]KIQ16837.1 hypothetical protein RU01_13015 [Rhodococcus sp. MEB064]